MIITYFRSSSFNKWDFCPQAYFGEYVLGYYGESNLKADMGTIFHKIMELLAKCKQASDNNTKYVDELVGEIDISIDIHELARRAYYQYTKIMSHQKWTDTELETIDKWLVKALAYNDGQIDPRKLNIVQPEQHFDIRIEEPWAIVDGDFLSLKGTIDLIIKLDDNTYEICDYKTGRKYDWSKDCDKTYESLVCDPQLLMYYYAGQKLYPQIENFVTSIAYINDGGVSSMCFSKDKIPYIENMLRKRFEEIKRCTRPKLNRSWKCRKLCTFGKTTFAGTKIRPLTEHRPGKIANCGDIMTKCDQIDYQIGLVGIDKTIEQYKVPEHEIGFYKSPGGL